MNNKFFRELGGKKIRPVSLEEEGLARDVIELSGSTGEMNDLNSYTGCIVGFQVAGNCEFPDNNTECITALDRGINLHGYVDNYGSQKLEPIMMHRIRIINGKCLVYIR